MAAEGVRGVRQLQREQHHQLALLAGNVADMLHCGCDRDNAAYDHRGDIAPPEKLAELVADMRSSDVIDQALADTRALLSRPDVVPRLQALAQAAGHATPAHVPGRPRRVAQRC